MKIVVLGSTGRVGSNLLAAALERGHEVLAIARHPENLKLKHDKLQVKNINIFDEDVLAEELKGQDALISCLGGAPSLFNRKPVTIYTDSAKVFPNAARKGGLSRLILMGGWPITSDRIPWYVKPATLYYGSLINNMLEMETVLKDNCADLDYTVVKMPTGRGQNESGKPIKAHEGQCVPGVTFGLITYGDVSKFILEGCLVNGEWKKKLVSINGG